MEILKQIKKNVQEDAAFSASLKAAKTPEEVLKVLLAAGFQVTMEDLLAMAKPDAAGLSDEQLETVSGGTLRPTHVPWPFW